MRKRHMHNNLSYVIFEIQISIDTTKNIQMGVTDIIITDIISRNLYKKWTEITRQF